MDRAGDTIAEYRRLVGAWRCIVICARSVGQAEPDLSKVSIVNGILTQYMMRTILAMTALVLIVLLALAGLFEFIAELDDTRR